jgi:hypothetical protein
MLPIAAPTDVGGVDKADELRMAAFGSVAGTEVRLVTLVNGSLLGAGSFSYAQVPISLQRSFQTSGGLTYAPGPATQPPSFLPPLPLPVGAPVPVGQLGSMVGVADGPQVRLGFVGGAGNTPVAWTGVGGKVGAGCLPQMANDPSPAAGSAYAAGCAAAVDQVPNVTKAVIYVYVK